MQIDIKLVEAFALIMRCGSLTKAESLAGISKATLSRQLLKLEEELGVQLITRMARRIAPTEAGRAFHTHCEALLTEVSGRLESARTEVQELNSGDKGRLTLLTDNQFSTTFVCHVARLFLQRYPNVQCILDTAGVADSPQIEDVDCYICAEAPELTDVVGKLMGRLSYGLYASPGYLQSHGTPSTPRELARHSAVFLKETQAGGPTVLHSEQSSHPYLARAAISTNDYWVMKTFCIDGAGIALLPDYFALPEVRRGILQPVLPGWKPERKRIYCAYRRQRYVGRKLRAFIELAGQSMSEIGSYNLYVASAPG